MFTMVARVLAVAVALVFGAVGLFTLLLIVAII
ncbi:hypothetical protein BH18ACT11_BH18ACT11_16300 [soil metagenome]